MATTNTHAGGIPLDEYTKNVPPGWKPGLDHYPLKSYLDKIKIWWHLTDLQETEIGPAMASRLKLGPWNLSILLPLSRREPRPRPALQFADLHLFERLPRSELAFFSFVVETPYP